MKALLICHRLVGNPVLPITVPVSRWLDESSAFGCLTGQYNVWWCSDQNFATSHWFCTAFKALAASV
jgi:hypothetical protein